MRKIQLVIGIVLALGAFFGITMWNKVNQPPTYTVAVVVEQVPAYTPLSPDFISLDTQTLSPAVAEKYVSSGELNALLTEGAVVVEALHPGQPLLREQVASGAAAAGLNRLSVALRDPDRVIVSVPVDVETLPYTVPGDVIALYFAAGHIQAGEMVTDVVEMPEVTAATSDTGSVPVVDAYRPRTEPVTTTVELVMPVAKRIGSGVVYRLDYAQRENPNYGAPGMESEPRYVTGEIRSLDVVVHQAEAEWFVFALAHGEVQVAVMPAVTRPDVEAGVFPDTAGVTWTDFEQRFFADRMEDRPQDARVTAETAIEGFERSLDEWGGGR